MIYFVRHGQTDDNIKDIISGGNRDVPLNQTGQEQAKLIAQKLKDFHFDVVYCSPMKRAQQTANEILKFHQNVPVVFDNRLKERNFGEIEGVKDNNSALYTKVWNMNSNFQADGLESVDDMYARISSFYDEIIKKHPNENVLVVAHYGVGRISCCYFCGFPEDKDLNHYVFDNCEFRIFNPKKIKQK